MPEIPDYDYRTFPLETKYRWMQEGSGVDGTAPSARSLGALAPAFEESASVLQSALRGTGATWRGTASNAVSGSLHQTAQWASTTARNSKTGGNQIDTYTESFSRAKNSIPLPVDVGENSFLGGIADSKFGHVFGMQSDYNKRLAEHREADQIASDAMKDYETTARAAIGAFPTDQTASPVQPNNAPLRPVDGPDVAGTTSVVGDTTRLSTNTHDQTGSGNSGTGSNPDEVQRTADYRATAARGSEPKGFATIHPDPAAASESWTPLTPYSPGRRTTPSGITPDLADGLIPAPTTYEATRDRDTPRNSPRASRSTQRVNRFDAHEDLPTTSGIRAALEPGNRGFSGAPAATRSGPNAAETARGPAGMPPIGHSPTRKNQEHRNRRFMPSDDPFAFETNEATPAVIGLPDGPETTEPPQ